MRIVAYVPNVGRNLLLDKDAGLVQDKGSEVGCGESVPNAQVGLHSGRMEAAAVS